MAFVIAAPCIDVKDGACTDVCPVDCIYEGGRMFYIQPDECINCALCVSVCPVEAIWEDDEIPGEFAFYTEINAEFFEENVTGWGEPGGWGPEFCTDSDHPVVATAPAARD